MSKRTPLLTYPAGKGFSVVITREDGTEFYASSGVGLLPLLHHQRKDAVQYKRELAEHRMKGRVVPVVFGAVREVRQKRKTTKRKATK